MARHFTMLLCGCCLWSVGCQLQQIDAPPILDAVLQNIPAFRPDASSALLDSPAGTPVDALADNLVGCWGKVLDENGTAVLSLTEALRFGEDGTYDRWQFGQLTPLLPLIVRETGTYEIVDAGQVRMLREHIFSQQPGGALQEVGVAPLEMTAFITVDGNEMTFVLGDDSDSVPANERVYYLYQRYDCP